MFPKSIEKRLAMRKVLHPSQAKSPNGSDGYRAREDLPAPPMRVVTKGWWTLKEERVPVEVLAEEDRCEQSQTKRS
jgi:hypothetical protein